MDNRTDREIVIDLIDLFLENKYVDEVPSSITLRLLRQRLTEPLPTLK